MKSKVGKIVLFSLLLIVIIIGYKFYCFIKYDESENNQLSEVNFIGNMSVNHVELDDSDYIKLNNIKFKNIFDGYEKFNEETDTYKMILKEEEKAIFIGVENSFLYIMLNNNEYKKLFSKIVEKENIKDDVDLLKYMEAHQEDNVTFLMSTKKQKQIYIMNEFKSNMLPSIDYVKTINGYFRGYMFKNTKDITSVNILKGDKSYYFTFIGDYSEDFINDFMNTVVIE